MIKITKSFIASLAILGVTISSSFAAKQIFTSNEKQLSFIEKAELAKNLLPLNFHKLFDAIFIEMPQETTAELFKVTLTQKLDINKMYDEIFYPLMELDTNPINFILGNFKNLQNDADDKLKEMDAKYDKYDSPVDMLYNKLVSMQALLTGKSLAQYLLNDLQMIIDFVGKINDLKRDATLSPLLSPLKILELSASEHYKKYPQIR